MAMNPPALDPPFEFALDEDEEFDALDEDVPDEPEEKSEDEPDEAVELVLADEEVVPLCPPDAPLSVTDDDVEVAESVSVSGVGDPPAKAENAVTVVNTKAIERTELRISRPLIFS